jgi:hypothetical protein
MSSDLRIDLGALIAHRRLPLAADAQARKLNICSGGTKLTVVGCARSLAITVPKIRWR